ncbi:MAG: hypothetical protein RL732_553 [Bacteroidota bacterium]|jgi:carboxymethylenebutenolidase
MKLIFLLMNLLLYPFLGSVVPDTGLFTAPAPKEDIVSCAPNGTMETYQREASLPSFAGMHLAPKMIQQTQFKGSLLSFPCSDGKTGNAYFIPATKKSKKWLIVVHEWWGLNDNIKAEADKYAGDLSQMNVLAIDLYDGKVASTPDSAMKLTRSADFNRMSTIINGAIQWAGKKASIYSVGWCFGGMWSLQTAILAGAQGKGTVMFYGRPETKMEKLQSIQCEVLGFFGNLDRSPTPAMVSEFEANMKAAGKQLTTFKYEAGHGFANPSNPSFNEAAAADSYTKAIAFLKSH